MSNAAVREHLEDISRRLHFDIFSRDPNSSYYNALRNMDMVVLGAGGIGSNLITMLCKIASVSRIVVIDDDQVEPHNLNRTAYRICDIGKYKVSAISNICANINPTVDIVPVIGRVGDGNAGDVALSSEFTDRVVVFDCRDDAYNDYGKIDLLLSRFVYFVRVAYDGDSITLDSDPENNPVWTNTNSGYTQNVSHSIPSVYTSLIAIQAACSKIMTDYKLTVTINSRKLLLYTQIGGIVDKLFNRVGEDRAKKFISLALLLGESAISTTDMELLIDDLSDVLDRRMSANSTEME